MKIPVLFLSKIREHLPEFLRQELDEIMRKCREAHAKEGKKYREAHAENREAHAEIPVRLTQKNGEFGSKTAFSAENREAHAYRGGEGGGSLNTNSTSNTVTADDVTSTISLKEKNKQKRKENCEAHGEAHKKAKNIYSPDFEEIHEIYPNKEGKLKAFEAWKKWKREGTLPDKEYLIACVEIFRQSDKWLSENGRFIPMIDTFMRGRRWEALSERKVLAWIASKKGKETKTAAIAGPDMLKCYETQEKTEDVTLLKLPPLNVWKAASYERKVEFADRLGFVPGDFSSEIERRMREAS